MSTSFDKLIDLDLLGAFKANADVLYAKQADLTTTDGKVDALEKAGGEPNKIDIVKRNGVTLAINSTDKSVDVTVPTKTSELTNDSNLAVDANYVHTDNNLTDAYVSLINSAVQAESDPTVPAWAKAASKPTYTASEVGARASTWTPTASEVGAYTKTETDSAISAAIGQVTQISYSVVESLPEMGAAGVIYMVTNGGSDPNEYNEYVWSNDRFELIGQREVDLTDYEKASDISLATSDEVKALFSSSTTTE